MRLKQKILLLFVFSAIAFIGISIAPEKAEARRAEKWNDPVYCEFREGNEIKVCGTYWAWPANFDNIWWQVYSARIDWPVPFTYNRYGSHFGAGRVRVTVCLARSAMYEPGAPCQIIIPDQHLNSEQGALWPLSVGPWTLDGNDISDYNIFIVEIAATSAGIRVPHQRVDSRRVSIDSFRVMDMDNNEITSVSVGQQFKVDWQVADSTARKLFFNTPWSNGLQSADVAEVDSWTFTATSPGTATFDVWAQGPGWNGLTLAVTSQQNLADAAQPTTKTLQILGIPDQFSMDVSCVQGGSPHAHISWDTANGATSYSIERHYWSTGSWSEIGTTTDTEYDDYGVRHDWDSYYRVIAHNAAGDRVSDNEDGLAQNSCHGGNLRVWNASQSRWDESPAGSPVTVANGSRVNLTWESANMTSCTVTPNPNPFSSSWSGISNPNQQTNQLTSNTVFTMSCNGPAGGFTDTATVNVTGPPAPIADIKAGGQDSMPIASGGSTTISWSSENTTSCSVTSSPAPSVNWTGTSGSQNSGAITSNKTYSLSCTGAGGNASDSVTITVVNVPTVDLMANGSNGPVSIPTGSSANLSWTVGNGPTSCSLVKDGATTIWTGTANGSQSTGALSYSATYLLTCSNIAGSASDSVLINSGASITFSVTYTAAAMGTPVITVPINNSTCGSIVLSWTYSSPGGDPIQYFTVWRSTVSGSIGSQIWSSSGAGNATTVRSYTDTTVSPDTTYFYTVRAEENTPVRQWVASAQQGVQSAACSANLSANMRITQVDGQAYNSNTTVIKDGSRITYQLIISNAGPGAATITSICDNLSPNLFRSSGGDISPSNISASGNGISTANSSPVWNSCKDATSAALNIQGVKQPSSIDATNWVITFNAIFKKTGGVTSSYESCSNSAEIFFTDPASKSYTASVPNALCKTGKNVSPDYREVNP